MRSSVISVFSGEPDLKLYSLKGLARGPWGHKTVEIEAAGCGHLKLMSFLHTRKPPKETRHGLKGSRVLLYLHTWILFISGFKQSFWHTNFGNN